MGKGEKKVFPLWLKSVGQNKDKVMWKIGVRSVLQRWARRKGLAEWVVDVLVPGWGEVMVALTVVERRLTTLGKWHGLP